MQTPIRAPIRWRVIAEDLEREITAGRFSPGDRLPTEAELALSYQVNRHTVRRALSHLVSIELLEVTQGRGTFVRRVMEAFSLAPELGFLRPVTTSLLANGAPLVTADASLCARLRLDRGARVFVIEAKVMRGEDGLALLTIQAPEARVPALGAIMARTGSLEAGLVAAGLDGAVASSPRVRARAASSRELAALNSPRHAPILGVDAVFTNEDGRALMAKEWRMAADRVYINVGRRRASTSLGLQP